MELKIKRINNDAIIPRYAHEGDAGMDLFSCDDDTIKPSERKLIKTGLCFEIPEGFELQIRPRSGLALKKGISVLNTPGTVDAGYRGELGVILINLGDEDFRVSKGDRIAQAVLNKVETAKIRVVEDLSETSRGDGGFGSSGF